MEDKVLIKELVKLYPELNYRLLYGWIRKDYRDIENICFRDGRKIYISKKRFEKWYKKRNFKPILNLRKKDSTIPDIDKFLRHLYGWPDFNLNSLE